VRWLALAVATLVAVAVAHAELENLVFTSKPDQLRMVVPRGWRATDQPSYPGILLWMARTQPDAHLVLTAEAFTRKLYCSWPLTCRKTHDALPSQLACALRSDLQAQHMRVGPIQAGPKENEAAGMPSVWFEYDDGRHFFRQAVALTEDRVVSLLLSAPSSEGRTAYARPFEQALRTLRPLTAEELQTAAGSAAPPPPPSDQPPVDAGVLADAGTETPRATTFQAAPAPKVNPVGSCTTQ
jgi:hypothetical protein